MARLHFVGLNPDFRPLPEWEANYLESYLAQAGTEVRWVQVEGEHAGFVVFGWRPHATLPWRIGHINELFIVPERRRTGLGRRVADLMLQSLASAGCKRVDLEIMDGNHAATKLWRKLGFHKHSERWARSSVSS